MWNNWNCPLPASQLAAALNLSDNTVLQILHLDLHFHPYKTAIEQQLKPQDYTWCTSFTQMTEYINILNFCYWSPTNPKQLHQCPLHSGKVTVCVCVTKNGIIGPHFFKDNGHTATVNGECYLSMLQIFLIPELQKEAHCSLSSFVPAGWGNSTHTANIGMYYLQPKFPVWLISHHGDITWPARSPDLSMWIFSMGVS